jgi:hypothetical protein
MPRNCKLIVLIALVSFLPSFASEYRNLSPIVTNDDRVRLQIHSNSLNVNLDANPELRFRLRLSPSMRGSVGLKLYKSTDGERGRLISMRNPRIQPKAKALIIDMPLNGVRSLSEMIVEVSNSSNTLINSYTTTISSRSGTEDEYDVLGGVEGSDGTTEVFIRENNVIHAEDLESDEHFIFGSEQINNIEGTDDDNRLMFLRGAKQGAFRAGKASGTQWDANNIGLSSIGLGSNVKASGENSVSLGTDNQSTGMQSLTIGNNAISNQPESIAIGNNVSSIHAYAMVIGSGNSAEDPLKSTGDSSMTIGFNSNAATMYISPSAGNNSTGRVGIGTSNPNSYVKLDVAGPVRLRAQAALPTCDNNTAGTIIFFNNHLRGCNGYGGWDYLGF